MKKYLLIITLFITGSVLAQPGITSFTPTVAGAGMSLTITGTNFTGATAVTLGGTAAASFSVLSSTTIVAVVGTGASGAISVTTSGGTGSISGFVFTQAPIISSFTPLIATPGTAVTISGWGFSTTSASNIVYFGAVKAVVNSATTTSLSVTVPVGAMYAPITVINTGNNLLTVSAASFNPSFTGATGGLSATNFAAKQEVSTGNYGSTDLLTTDLDGDGKPDVITLNATDLKINFYRNTSTASTISFAAPVSIAVTNDAYTAAIGDLDGDGKMDIAFVNLNSNLIHVLFNKSTVGSLNIAPATFESPVGSGNYYNGNMTFNPGGTRPSGVSIADIDGDGKADVIVTNTNSNTVSVSLNKGLQPSVALLATALTFTTGTVIQPHLVRTADIDGDGKLDLLVSTEHYDGPGLTNNKFSIFRNTSIAGTASFTRVDIASTPVPQSIFAADLDGDGKTDLVIDDNVNNTVSYYRNTSTPGSISLSSKTDISTPVPVYNFTVSDFDGDGKPDIITGNYNNATVSIFRNISTTGTISFSGGFTLTGSAGPNPIQAVDFNGDGRIDIAVGNRGPATFSVFKNLCAQPVVTGFTPTMAATNATVQITGNNFTGATAVTFGGTAALTFTVNSSTSINAVVGVGSTGSITVTTLPGASGSKAGFTYIPPPPAIASVLPLSGVIGTRVTITGSNFVSPMTVTFGGVAAASFTVLSSTSVVAVVGVGLSGTINLTALGGSTAFSGFEYIPPPVISSFTPLSATPGSSVTISGSGFNRSAGDNTVFFGPVKAVVTAATANSLIVTVPVGATFGPVTVLNNSVNLITMSADNFDPTFGASGGGFTAADFAAKNDVSTGSYGNTDLLTGDLDGDGKPDIVTLTATDNKINFFRNTSSLTTISFSAPVSMTTTNDAYTGALGDLDGDGKLDIAIVLLNSNQVRVLFNKSTPGTFNIAPASFEWPSGSGNNYSGNLYFNPGGTRPSGVSIVDVDGDGRADITVTNTNSSTVSVSLNKGLQPAQSMFATPVTFSLGTVIQPHLVRVADLDSDGKPDLVVTTEHYDGPGLTNNKFSIFRNTSVAGVVNFTRIDIAAPPIPWSVITADLDGDGKPDIVVADYNNNIISYYRNTSTSGNITLSAKVDITVASPAYNFAVSDLDGDGKPDLVIGNYNSSRITLLRNVSTTGTIGFSGAITLTGSSGPNSIQVVDLNGDGRGDIVVANRGATTFSVFKSLMASPVVTGFSPASAIAGATVQISGQNLGAVTAVSFGGTAALTFTIQSPTSISAVVGYGSSGSVSTTSYGVSAAMTGFTYIPPPVITSVSPLTAVAGSSVTISGSGFNTTAGSNIVFFGAVKGVVTSATATTLVVTVPVGAMYAPITVLNAGINLITASRDIFNPVFSGATGGITASDFADKVDVPMGNYGTTDVLAGDLDGDGKPDIVTLNGVDNKILLFRNTSTATAISFASPVAITSANDIYTGALGDLDGDGKLDMAFVYINSNQVRVLLNKSTVGSFNVGPTSFEWPTGSGDYYSGSFYFDPGGARPSGVAISDIDGDGRADIIVTNTDSSTISVSLNKGLKSGQLQLNAPVIFSLGTVIQPHLVRVADIDNDGKPDLLVTTEHYDGPGLTNNKFSIFRNTSIAGTASFTRIDIASTPVPGSIVAADLDGDGKLDIVVNDFNNNTVSYYRNTSTPGSINLSAKTDITVAAPAYNFTISDFDGDGKPDLVVGVYFSSMIAVFRNTSTTGTISFGGAITLTGSSGPNSMQAADFNGDGRIDIAVGNRGTPTFSIFKNLVNLPVIASFTPASGTTNTVVEITGQGFNNVTAVSFGGTAALTFTVNSSTSITAVVDTGDSGAVQVTANGNTDSKMEFAYYSDEGMRSLAVTGELSPFAELTPSVNDTLKVTLYPNPATPGNTFYVVGTLKKVTNAVARLTVTTATGKLVVQSNRFAFLGKEIRIPLSLTAKGTYFVKLDVNGTAKTQTIIIE